MRRVFISFLFLCAAVMQAQKINPSTQINWPGNCNSGAPLYNIYTGLCVAPYTLPSTVVQTNQANTYSTGLQDFSAASIKQPATYTVGSNTITNPTSAGTLALTSQLSAYAALSGAVFTGAVNGTLYANPTASDFCVEIARLLALLPAGGGNIDARGFQGGSCAATLTINTPVRILADVGTFTFSGNPGINITSANVIIEGSGCSLGEVGTLLKSGAAGPLIADTTNGADGLQVKNLCLDGNSQQGTWGIFAPYGANSTFEKVTVKNFAYQGILSTQGVGTFLNNYASNNGEGFMFASDTRFEGQSQSETNTPGSGIHVISGGNLISCQSCDNNGYYGILIDGRAWSDWAGSTAYTAFQIIVPTTGNAGGYAFEATSAGTTSGSRPTFPQTPGAVSAADGGVLWANIGIEYASNSVQNNHLTNNYVDDNGTSGSGGNVRIWGNATTATQQEFVTSLYVSQAVQTTRPVNALELDYVQQGTVSDVNWLGSNYGGSGADTGGLLISHSTQVEVTNFTTLDTAVTPLSVVASVDVHVKGADILYNASTGTATASQYCASIDSNSYRVTLDDLDCVSGATNTNMRGVINAGTYTSISGYKNYTATAIDTWTAAPVKQDEDLGGTESLSLNGNTINTAAYQASSYFQKALSLVAGTYTDGDMCTYASSGTLLNCNTTVPTTIANIAGGAAGDVLYQSAANTTGFSGAGTTGQTLVSGGTGAPTFSNIWMPVHFSPAACNNTTAGSGFSLPVSNAATPFCRTGTYVQTGYLQFTGGTTSQSAQFQTEVPGDIDTSAVPYVRLNYTQGTDTTNGHVIAMQVQSVCGATTDDIAWPTATAFPTTTPSSGGAANDQYTVTVQLSAANFPAACSGGTIMNFNISTVTTTNTNTTVNLQMVTVTWPEKTPGVAGAN